MEVCYGHKYYTENRCYLFIKTLEEFDYNFSVGVNRKQIEELSTLGFIKRKENIILLGQSGVGKTQFGNCSCIQSRNE